MEKKQSSIDLFAIALYEKGFLKGNGDEINDLLEEHKAMHKEEIVNTWTEATAPTHEIGLSDTTYILAQIKKAEQYYKEKFGGNNE